MKRFKIKNKRKEARKFAHFANRTKKQNVQIPLSRNGIILS